MNHVAFFFNPDEMIHVTNLLNNWKFYTQGNFLP